MSFKLLTEHYLEFLSIKVGCTSSSESTVVKMSHCWKSHVTAHIIYKCNFLTIDRKFNFKLLSQKKNLVYKILIRKADIEGPIYEHYNLFIKVCFHVVIKGSIFTL